MNDLVNAMAMVDCLEFDISELKSEILRTNISCYVEDNISETERNNKIVELQQEINELEEQLKEFKDIVLEGQLKEFKDITKNTSES